MIAELGFWPTVGVEVIKALATAGFVVGAAGIFVQRLQNKADGRLRNREREQLEEKERLALKQRFVARTAQERERYLATQRFWRQTSDSAIWGVADKPAFDDCYHRFASAGYVLERELQARYGESSDVATHVHQRIALESRSRIGVKNGLPPAKTHRCYSTRPD